MAERYDTARICENGHIINGALSMAPQDTTKFCSHCGAKGIDICSACNSQIRGASLYSTFHGDWNIGGPLLRPPAYCQSCGVPFPWTTQRLEVARELISEMDELVDADKESLKLSLPDLVKDSPRSEIAVSRYRKIIAKAADTSREGLKKLLWMVVTEATKKALF